MAMCGEDEIGAGKWEGICEGCFEREPVIKGSKVCG